MGIYLKQVRHGIVHGLQGPEGARLIAAVEDRVFGHRTAAVQKKEGLLIRVWTNKETAEVEVDNPLEYRKTAEIAIELVTKLPAVHGNLELDVLDEVGQLIEDFMASVEIAGCQSLIYQGFASGQEVESEHPTAVGSWTYELEYLELSPRDPNSTLVPFERLGADYDLTGSPDGNEASDLVEIPQ
ncbi:MAG: hypothetical protein JKY61_12910 [Planctomycetes bacterium]|nr:hypothetical protein [Planctomycetota bacterium]